MLTRVLTSKAVGLVIAALPMAALVAYLLKLLPEAGLFAAIAVVVVKSAAELFVAERRFRAARRPDDDGAAAR